MKNNTSGKAVVRSAAKREIAVNNALLKLSNIIHKNGIVSVRDIICHKLTGSLYTSYKTVVDSSDCGFSQNEWQFSPASCFRLSGDSDGQFLVCNSISVMDNYLLKMLGYQVFLVAGRWRISGKCKTFTKRYKDRSKRGRGMYVNLADFDQKMMCASNNVHEFDTTEVINGIKESSLRINELQVKINELQQELDHELNNKDALVAIVEEHIHSL
jgi:hypothetical protein